MSRFLFTNIDLTSHVVLIAFTLQSYLMGYHPHGVLGYGAIAAFGTDVLKFPEIFPGLTPRLITLKLNFQVGCFCHCKILLLQGDHSQW